MAHPRFVLKLLLPSSSNMWVVCMVHASALHRRLHNNQPRRLTTLPPCMPWGLIGCGVLRQLERVRTGLQLQLLWGELTSRGHHRRSLSLPLRLCLPVSTASSPHITALTQRQR